MRKSDWFVLLSRVPRTILPLTFDQVMFYIIPKKSDVFHSNAFSDHQKE